MAKLYLQEVQILRLVDHFLSNALTACATPEKAAPKYNTRIKLGSTLMQSEWKSLDCLQTSLLPSDRKNCFQSSASSLKDILRNLNNFVVVFLYNSRGFFIPYESQISFLEVVSWWFSPDFNISACSLGNLLLLYFEILLRSVFSSHAIE